MSNFLEWGISEARKWKCVNCDGFHGYGNCPYDEQRRENQPDTCWEGYENPNSWNPPHHHYYEEYEHQPFVQEEAWIEAEVQKRLAQKLQEEAFIEAAVQERLAQLLQELQIEEISFPQVLEEDEEVEAPKEASEVVIELECEKMVVEQKEQVVECADFKVPIVDFVFGDKLMIDEEKPPSISTYLMNLWSTGAQGNEQAGEWNKFGSTWNRISKKFLNPIILYLIKLALMSYRCCNTMMELGQNLHDLKGLKNFAIDTG